MLRILSIVFVLYSSALWSAESSLNNSAEKSLVHLYTYHYKPPFLIDTLAQQGFYYDVVDYFNEQSELYQFKVTYLPRKRLDCLLGQQQLNGIVMGVLPEWFGDANEQNYQWLPGFFPDKDAFVSLTSTPFEYINQASLTGKVIGCVAGHYYFNVNEAVEKELAQRIDTVAEYQVLQLVKKRRADFGLISESTFKYFAKHSDFTGDFHVSQKSHDEYSRRAFITSTQPKLHEEMRRLFALAQSTGSWQSLREKYE